MTTLHGHWSPDTALVQEDYPYGFTLRCTRLVWLEYKKGHGYRMVTQTSNPKKRGVWNKPKAGVYHDLAVLYLDEEGHVQIDCIRPAWDSVARIDQFAAQHAVGLQEDRERQILQAIRTLSAAYEARHAS